MSLVYNEFEGSNKNGSDDELKMEKEKSEFNSKKKSTRRKASSKDEEEKKDPIPNPNTQKIIYIYTIINYQKIYKY